MSSDFGLTCPYCGEPVDVAIDEGGGESQSYVEDCENCCHPILLSYTAEEGAVVTFAAERAQ